MKNNENKSIVIITPIFEDLEAAKVLFKEIYKELGKKVFVVAVDDGSVVNPMSISIFDQTGLEGLLLKLNCNIGHQKAIAVGLSYVAEKIDNVDTIVVMDSDGEDSPSSIKELINILYSSDSDIIAARRKKRFVSMNFQIFYTIYKLIFWVFVGRKINFGNFIALKYSVVKRLVSMNELWLNLAACVLISKLRVSICELDRGRRYTGISKMNFVSLALHGFRALMVFAEDVLVRVGIVCSLFAVLSVFGGIVAVFLKIMGFATPGWFSMTLGILLIVFLQTGALALITLMLTGVVRSRSLETVDYKGFILEVHHANLKAVNKIIN